MQLYILCRDNNPYSTEYIKLHTLHPITKEVLQFSGAEPIKSPLLAQDRMAKS